MIKSITLNDLVQRHGSWLETGVNEGPVISSRVRLARNLDAYYFPSWAPKIKSMLFGTSRTRYFHLVISPTCAGKWVQYQKWIESFYLNAI